MVDIENKILSISVIKRNGKKTNFDGSKIAVAIKKVLIVLILMKKKNITRRIYKKYIKK